MSPVSASQDSVTIHGHLLDVIIHCEPGAPLEDGVRPSYECGALIDTGASDICVDYRIAHALKLRRVDQRSIGTAGGPIIVDVYNGLFEVPMLGFKKMMRIFAPKIDRINYSVLIGRSLLNEYIVTFDGPNRICHFAHPSELLREPPDDFK